MNEAERTGSSSGDAAYQKALRRYECLDPKATFDRIIRLASNVFEVPVAQVKLVGTEQQWTEPSSENDTAEWKSTRAAKLLEKFCHYAIESPGPIAIENAAEAERFADHPLVTGPPHIRLYAGAPLTAPGGHRIGTLCLMDSEPREISEEELSQLQDLADLAMGVLDLARGRAEHAAAKAREAKKRQAETQAREFSEAIVEGLPGVFYLFDESGQIKQWNSRLLEVTGYTPAEVKKMHPLDFVREGDSLSVESEIHRVFEEGQSSVVAYFQPKRGKPAPYLFHGKRLLINGEPHLAGMGVDISERKAMEEALQRSEQRHRHLVEGASDITIVVDEKGTYKYTSPAFERILGWKAEAGTDSLEAVHPDDRECVAEALAAVAEEPGRIRSVEFRYRHADGSWLYLEAVGRNLLDDPAVAGIVVNSREVNERVEAQRELHESEKRFRRVVENAHDVIFEVDAEGRWTFLSPSWEEITGYSIEESLGRRFTEFFYPERQESVEEFRSRIVPSGTVEDVQVPYHTKDGRRRWFNIRSRLLRGSEGEVIRGTGTLTDVTDSMRFREERKARRRAEELLRAKTSLLNNMSHELRTPMAAIIGFAEVLEEEAEGEIQQEFAERIYSGGKRLQKTLNSVLELAQLEGTGTDLELEPIDVAAAAEEASGLFRPIAEAKGLRFRVEVAPEEMLAALEEDAVHRILSNLLSNAIKFTDEGEVVVNVEAGAEVICLRVEDTGIGMSEAFQEHLFEDFVQESTGLARTHEGCGLGLAITKRLVELMDGAIEVESQKGEGSTFTVSFARMHLESDSMDGPVRSGNEDDLESNASEEPSTDERPSVLLVEDNSNTRRLVEHLIGQRCILVSTSSYEEALAKAEDYSGGVDTPAGESYFDLLLLDINLGEGLTRNGTDLLHKLRQWTACSDAMAVAMTAYATPADREHFMEAGFDDHLPKPFYKDQLLELLKKACDRGAVPGRGGRN